MPDFILALDIGTTSVRAMVVDRDRKPVAVRSVLNRLLYPSPGLVEQDAQNLWSNVCSAMTGVLMEADIGPEDVAAIGVTAQRSCVVVWDRKTVEPLSPVISWQDLRAVNTVGTLVDQGFLVVHQMAAAKLESAVSSIENGYARAQADELAFGNVDTFVIAKLSAGRVHAMDLTHLSATGYYDYVGGFNDALANAQGLPRSMFPEIGNTVQNYGVTAPEVFGAEVVIGAIVADQQAAMAAQDCTRAGLGKVTYGTSGTLNVHTGNELKFATGAYPLVMRNHGDSIEYMLEGMVITAGAMFDWLSEALGLMETAAASEALAGQVKDSGSVFVLPALQGLGSPHNAPDQHAVISGLTRGSNKAHVVRAAMEGVASRVREAFDQIFTELSDFERPTSLRVDGGATRNDLFMQIQADILGIPVERNAVSEATAFGAALYAGETVGFWRLDDCGDYRIVDRTFLPQWSDDQRQNFFSTWKKASEIIRKT